MNMSLTFFILMLAIIQIAAAAAFTLIILNALHRIAMQVSQHDESEQ